jgi:hypothetical protein
VDGLRDRYDLFLAESAALHRSVFCRNSYRRETPFLIGPVQRCDVTYLFVFFRNPHRAHLVSESEGKKMRSRILRFTGAVLVCTCLAFGGPPKPPDSAPAWMKHAWWCTADGGNAGAAYKAARWNNKDGYEAVLACQEAANDPAAKEAVRVAGRENINKYVGPPPPSERQGPTDHTGR